MAKCFIDDNTLTNIGNAIRSVNGSSDLMLPSAMPDAISSLNNGLYVWKKYALSNKLVLIGEGTPNGIVSANGNISFVLAVLFDDFSGHPYYDSNKNYLGILESSDSIIEGYYYVDKDSGVKLIESIYDSGASYTIWKQNSYFAPIGNNLFVEFSVSNNENVYPDKAVHADGFYYEKYNNSTLIPENIREGIDIWGVVGTLVEGVAGIDFGEVTLTSTSSSVAFNHNLGVVPSFAAFIPKDNPTMGSSEETTLMNINGLIIYRKGFLNDKTGAYSYSYLRGTTDVTLTETTVSFNSASSYKFKKTTYYWIAIA